jgi:hypothetical protein
MVASGLYNESCIIIANLLAFSRTVRKTRMKIKRTQTTVTYDFEVASEEKITMQKLMRQLEQWQVL